MICTICKQEMTEEDSYTEGNKTICEDCYISNLKKRNHIAPQPCDPVAVSAATRTRDMLGQKGAQGLTKLQQDIYNFIKMKGKVTHQELMKEFNISSHQLQQEFAILRHCELVKGMKIKDMVFLTLMDN